jgi:dissimilatory sulfite reductase (desulfoviridin) alpha/beta subunit
MREGSKVETGANVKVQVPKVMAVEVVNVSCCPEVCPEVTEDVGVVLMEKASMEKLNVELSAS